MYRAPQEVRTYFTTFTTAGRRSIFQVEENAELMVNTLEVYRARKEFALHAFVVMPNHIHVLMTPAPEVSLEKAIQFIKGGFSFRMEREFEVWERGHFDKRVPDRAAYDACVEYIHRNPIAAGLAESEDVYRYSSAVRTGEIDPMPDWLNVSQG